MGDEKGKVEETVEKGVKGAEKGLKKGWGTVKDAGKKVEKAVTGEKTPEANVAEQKKCPQCETMNPKGATKCVNCGRVFT
jgi:membrane protease subunit (stomatin/prohibitin family)